MRRCIVAAVFIGGMVTSGITEAQQPVTTAHAADGDDKRSMDELLARRISVSLAKVSLRSALDSIARVAGVILQYGEPVLDAYPKLVSLDARQLPLGVVLERVLDGTQLRVKSDGQGDLAVVAVKGAADSMPVGGVLTGRVVDSVSGRGLPGATVKIAGRKLSAVTTDSGRFTLRDIQPGDYLLSIKVFGYRSAERSVSVTNGERTSVRIPMASVPNILSGVVTTAVGERDRMSVGNDITRIKVDSVLQTAPIKNVTDLLDGRVPGLTVQHTSGVPGAPSRLRLRGVGGGLIKGASGANNDPILIVDGVRVYAQSSTQRDQNAAAGNYTAPSPIDQIDPNSIETIDVLKGPSASSLYGPDAANGVIVITTKRGRAGPTRVNAVGEFGINYLPGTYAGPGFYQFGHSKVKGGPSRQCGTLLTGQDLNSEGAGADCMVDSVVKFQALTIPRLSLFGVGTTSSGSVTASGGTAALTYSLTGSATSTLGYLKMPSLYQDQYEEVYAQEVPQWMKRPNSYRSWSGTGVVTSTPLQGMQVIFSTSLSTNNQRQSSAQGGIAGLSGVYIDTTALQFNALGQYTQRVTSRGFNTSNSLTASWSRWAFLPVQAVGGISVEDREDRSFVPFGFLGPDVTDTLGSFTYGRPTSRTSTGMVSATAFPGRLVTTSAGFNVIRTTLQDFHGTAAHLSAGISSPDAFTLAGQVASSLTTAGWYVEPRLNLNSRFFVAPGFRLDNNGLVGNSTGQGLFSLLPKMDLSWIAVDRVGQRPMGGILTMLRPRVAFGVSSIQPDPAQKLRLFVPSGTDTSRAAINGRYPGAQLTAVGNPDLRPERSRELELGFDAELWESRVQLLVNRSMKLRYDAIVPAPIAPSAGSSSLTQYRNLGLVRDQGTEIVATLIPIQNPSTSWTVRGSYSAYRNIVIRVNGTEQKIDFGNGVRIVAGYPLDGRWDRPIIGYLPPGDGRKIGAADIFLADSVVFLGTAQPRYTLPVQSDLRLFGGTVGINVAVNYEHGFTQFGSGNANLLRNLYLNPDATLGEQAAVVAAFCVANKFVPGSSAFAAGYCPASGTLAGLIQTVNALRLNSLSVQFLVPSGMTRRFRLPRTSIALQGSNLGLWTGYRGKDPDVNGTPVGEAIQDDGQEPLPRTWGLRVTLGN